jgi:hypothetical protein
MALMAFDAAALGMLTYAGITAKPQDVVVLGNDLELVAEEFHDQTRSDDELATHAAHVLRERIGGYANLKSYLAVLHAGTTRNAKQ